MAFAWHLGYQVFWNYAIHQSTYGSLLYEWTTVTLCVKNRKNTFRKAFCPGDSDNSKSPVTNLSLCISSLRHFLVLGLKWNINASMLVKQTAIRTNKHCVRSILSNRLTSNNMKFYSASIMFLKIQPCANEFTLKMPRIWNVATNLNGLSLPVS